MFALLLWAIGFLILLSLWQWQLDRLVWKKNLIEQHQNEQSQTVLSELSPFNLRSSAYNKFFLKKYMARIENAAIDSKNLIFVSPRPKDNVKGSHVYYPFTLKDSDIAVIAMIGWVSDENKNTLMTTLEGLTPPDIINGYFVPDNQGTGAENFPEQNIWTSARITDMAQYFGYDVINPSEIDIFSNTNISVPLTFFYIEDNLAPDLIPRLYKDIQLKNDHAYYAQFWLSMAMAWTIVFLLAALWPIIAETLLKKNEQEQEQEQEQEENKEAEK